MYFIAALFILAFAFGVLVVTFRWIARLLARRLHGVESATIEQERGGSPTESPESPEPTPEEEAPSGAGTIHGANFALVLGILAALLFKVSPLALMLPAAGIFYGGRALYEGIRYFQVVLIRALIGVVLSVGSIGLHYLNLTGQLPDLTQLMTG